MTNQLNELYDNIGDLKKQIDKLTDEAEIADMTDELDNLVREFEDLEDYTFYMDHAFNDRV